MEEKKIIISNIMNEETNLSRLNNHPALDAALKSANLVDKLSNSLKINAPELPRLDLRNYNYADFKYEKIKEEIEKFQNQLTDEYDVMVQMATFGKEIIMSVDDIGFQNPDLLFFYGTINGQKAQLIQHQSQLNFLLLACQKVNSNDKPRRIGFIVNEDNN